MVRILLMGERAFVRGSPCTTRLRPPLSSMSSANYRTACREYIEVEVTSLEVRKRYLFMGYH